MNMRGHSPAGSPDASTRKRVTCLDVERAKRAAQVSAEVGFELETHPGTVELALRAPDGTVVRAFLDPDAADEIAADIAEAANDARQRGRR